jgi:pseudouridine-5'-phosphate glycosidase/pseudouridine kinase
VQLHSVVGSDLSGRAALGQLEAEGMSTEGIEVLPQPSRTAQYVAINNTNKDLTLAMADMKIFETIPAPTITRMLEKVSISPPKLLVLDANFDAGTLHEYLAIGRSSPITTTIFEPVSTAKALRIFPSTADRDTAHPFPHPIADIITPNEFELTALHNHAYSLGFFDHPTWFATIDALGIPPSGLRVPLAVTTTPAIVDAGIPQQAIKLLPFFPTILTKLGPQGVLLTQLLKADDPVLTSADESQYVLARCKTGDAKVGGLYVRLFPTEKVLRDDEVVSVNGIGDTFVGALAAGLTKGRRVQDVVGFAQRAAGLSLRSKESVSPELRGLKM